MFKTLKKNLVLFILTMIISLTFSNLRSLSQTTPESVSNPDILSELIGNLENNWEKQYENYFQSDFVNLTLNGNQISEKLLEIEELTKIKTGVIWLLPEEDRLQLFLITPGNFPINRNIFEANREDLLEVVDQFNHGIINPFIYGIGTNDEYKTPAQKLYQWIIAPIESNLEEASIDTLIFCLGEGLRSLPLAALYDGENFLIEKYSITRVPAFNLTNLAFREISDAKVLAMGASEFETQQSLPGVELELNSIVPNTWEGVSFINEEFTVNNLKSQREKQPFSIVHLATHAKFTSGEPKNSYIQFSDQRVDLEEIGDFNWDNPTVELLVLSACETALGDPNAELGFAGFAIHTGVKSALASLWDVSDMGTLGLMSEFYRVLKETNFKAEAIRQAQISLLKGKVYIDNGQLRSSRGNISLPPVIAPFEQDFSHPYYWSAFSLIGSPW